MEEGNHKSMETFCMLFSGLHLFKPAKDKGGGKLYYGESALACYAAVRATLMKCGSIKWCIAPEGLGHCHHIVYWVGH